MPGLKDSDGRRPPQPKFLLFQSLSQTLQPSELIPVVKGYTEFVSSEFPWSIISGLPVIRAEPATESVKFAYDCLKFREIS